MGAYESGSRAMPATSKKRKSVKRKSRKGQNGFLRLERAVAKLVEDRALLVDRVGRLRSEVDERDARVADLESELERSRKQREEATGRIDALISRLDEIESEVMAEPLPTAAVQGK